MIDLSRFGDDYHAITGYTVELGKYLHTWRKHGCVRATLTGPGFLLPLHDYDAAAGVLGKEISTGLRQLDPEAVRTIVEAELTHLTATEARAPSWAEFVVRLVYSDKVRGLSLEELRAYCLGDTTKHRSRPYDWHRLDPLVWAAIGELGFAIEYLEDGHWRWCSKERALALAAAPLSLQEYRKGLQDILQKLPAKTPAEPLPADYEACGQCGFDHGYEQEEASKVPHD